MTCVITDITESTNITPTIAIYKALPVNTAIQEAKPPRASEPVSPMNTEAGGTLKTRYAQSAPTSAKARVACEAFSPSNRIRIPRVKKKGTLTPDASPSKPSVRLTALTVARNTNAEKGITHHHLKGKTLGMIFTKASTRTRVSFEVGMYQLGGSALFLSGNDLQLGRGEPIEDTARVLSRFLDGIMIRTFKQDDVEKLAKHSSIPVVNGLTDYCHPCQVLADLQTIREFKGKLSGLKLAFIGDGNNMANSLIVGCIKVGMEIAIACPRGYEPDEEIVKWAMQEGKLTITTDPMVAVEGADAVYTDVWASMGQESEAQMRQNAFEGYQVNAELMAKANEGAMVLHCLPAHRGEEITAEVLEAHANEIFEEAENRMHAQKAVLVTLMK